MKKKLVRAFAALLVISVCVGIAPIASANASSPQASLYLSSYSDYIYPSGNGKMTIYYDVEGTGTMDQIGALSIRLQQKPSGSSTWTTVQTYSYTNYSNMLGSNTDYYFSNVNYAGISGYSYQAYVTVWAGKNGGGDSREILTAAVIA